MELKVFKIIKELIDVKKSNDSPFIYTMEKEVADTLIKDGFTLIPSNDEKFIFLNDSNLLFDKDTRYNKVYYTNKLFI